jgi:glycosyltransferase involved in cell wall biosynthesis
VSLPSRVGPLVDSLAEAVADVVVLAYDPPDPIGSEDSTDYLSSAQNVSFVSLGPKGTWRSHRSRSRRVGGIVRACISDRDLLLLQFPNRRAINVARAASGSRIAALIVGHSRSAIRQTGWPWRRKAASWLSAVTEDRNHRSILRRAGVVVTNSEELKRRYENDASPPAVLPLSGRRARYVHEASDRMTGEHVNLMLCGRMEREKGVFEALDAVIDLRNEDLGDRLRLHIVGSGGALPDLLRRAEQAGLRHAVVDHGWIPSGPKLFDLYRSMDVLLVPSYAEGLPYTVWEAMAHSVLVVCTPVGGLKDAFADELDVLFVPPGSSRAIADALGRLVLDAPLRRQMIAGAFERARIATLEANVAVILDLVRTRWPELAPQ